MDESWPTFIECHFSVQQKDKEVSRIKDDLGVKLEELNKLQSDLENQKKKNNVSFPSFICSIVNYLI